MQETILYLLSNAREEDSLSDFTNYLPDQLLNPFYDHQAAVLGLGLDAKYKSDGCPDNDHYPAMLQIFQFDFERRTGFFSPDDVDKPLQLDTVASSLDRYHLNPGDGYTTQTLSKFFNLKQIFFNSRHLQHFKGLPCRYDARDKSISFGQFGFPFSGLSELQNHELYRGILFFHKQFAETMKLLEHQKMSSLKIDAEDYYYFIPRGEDKYVKSLQTISVQKPHLLYIMCSSVDESICDDKMEHLLKRCSMKRDKDQTSTYTSFHFKSLHFSPMNLDAVQAIRITFCDEKLKKLRLQVGYPSYVILKIISTPKSLKSSMMLSPRRFLVYLSSKPTSLYPDNKNNHFRCRLPESLRFQQLSNWHCSLHSIIYPSSIDIKPSIALWMVIEDHSLENSVPISFPRHLEDSLAVVDFFKKNIQPYATVTSTNEGQIGLVFKHDQYTLRMSPNLALIIGQINVSNESQEFVIDVRTLEKPSKNSFVFSHRPSYTQLRPASLFVYVKSLIEHSMVGNQKLPLLSIVSMSSGKFSGKNERYHDVEISEEIFFKLQTSHIDEIEFYLKAIDNSDIAFSNPSDPVYLTLAFEYHKKV